MDMHFNKFRYVKIETASHMGYGVFASKNIPKD